MNYFKRKLWVIPAVASLSLAGALPTQALDFGFDLVFTSGPLNGQSFPGSITVDPDNGMIDGFTPGALRFDPDHGFEAINVTVDGVSFTISDDAGSEFDPPFPTSLILIPTGTILELDYISRPVNGAELLVQFFQDLNLVSFIQEVDGEFRASSGIFVQRTEPPPVSVPDAHASVAMLLATLAGLRWWSRRA